MGRPANELRAGIENCKLVSYQICKLNLRFEIYLRFENED